MVHHRNRTRGAAEIPRCELRVRPCRWCRAACYGSDIDHAERHRAIRRVLVITLVLNLAVAAAKGLYGLAAGSLAVAADGLHSLFDGAGNLVALVVMHWAAQPPDEGHPYGHAKHEVAASAVVGMIIAATGLQVAWRAADALAQGRPPIEAPEIGVAILVGTLAVNIGVALYERRMSRRLRSPILLADAGHTASDVIVTLGVLVAFGASVAGVKWADAAGALIVVAVVFWVAWEVLSRNVGVLLDRAAVDAAAVQARAERVPGVLSCHRVRSHGPPGSVRVDLHIILRADLPLREAHRLAHEVEASIVDHFDDVIEVVVHTEPEGDEIEGL